MTRTEPHFRNCWGNLPVSPDPFHWSADADRRLRRHIEIKL
jgi:hypothetical protein